MDDRPRIRPVNEATGRTPDRGRAFLVLLGITAVLAALAIPVLGFINFLYEKEVHGLPWE